MIIAPRINTKLSIKPAIPPKDPNLAICFNPFVVTNVIIATNAIANNPMVWVEFNPRNTQDAVVSLPNNRAENLIQKTEHKLTRKMITAEYHITIVIKAYFSPTDFSIHENIPPFSFLNAAPYSIIIKPNGIKNNIAANK